MPSDFHNALAERVAPYVAEEVALVAVAVSASPDTETVYAEALGVSPLTRLPPVIREQEPPEDLPDTGLLAEYPSDVGVVWTPLEDVPPAVLDLARQLPLRRTQADATVLRVADSVVSDLLLGDLRVDRDWIFLFTRETCAVRLHGGWVLAAEHGHVALFREVPVVRSVEVPWPPLEEWAPDIELEAKLRGLASDGSDLAGLVLRHGRFDVADPVAALLSGEEAPPVRLVRSWVSKLDEAVLVAIETELLNDLDALRDAADIDLQRVLILRDRVESRLRVLALAEREGRVRPAVKDVDAWAVARGLTGGGAPPDPRLHAAWLEPGPHWWARQ